MKIYCKNCEYLIKESDLPIYHRIFFRNVDKRINFMTPLCTVKLEKKTTESEDAIEKSYDVNYIVDNPFELNNTNTCRFYKRKWWKFWV